LIESIADESGRKAAFVKRIFDGVVGFALMNLPAASGRGILMDNIFYFSPQAAGNYTLCD
jgi:hypothetical protein